MKKTNLLFVATLLTTVFLMCGCHNTSPDDPVVVHETKAPTAEATGDITPTVNVTGDVTSKVTDVIAPSEEPTLAPRLEPTITSSPTEDIKDNMLTPTPIPYEGYVIGKDVNNNELKLTPEEADEFVMAGNILKLYDGSWFDIDDDGEPEYVSIQPYGHWTSQVYGNGEYIIENNGTSERRDVSIQTDQVFKIQFTGYDWIPLDVDYSRHEKGIPCKDDIFVCVTSLDGVTKQIITLGTRSYGDWYESDYYVFRSNKKSLIPCGWLRCNLTDFQLNAEKGLKATNG